jgi:hypothetical protein
MLKFAESTLPSIKDITNLKPELSAASVKKN